ncbi:MAG: hypothetical protein HYT09_01015, partial [Candidatus Levybacteria bacterium]|nr:hypothetical protein [Candidatus Levybacteria bacterium]
MSFREFSTYLEKLEATSSRLSLISILSELFKKIASNATAAPRSEIEEIVYLIQGRIAPFFAPVEIGMAEKSVAKSIANSFGVEAPQVVKKYQKLGDMGLTVYELAKKHESHLRQGFGGQAK